MRRTRIKYFFLILISILFSLACFKLILGKKTITTFTYHQINSKELFIQTKLDHMTLEEKVGQRFIWGINEPNLSSKSTELIMRTNAGGVIIMGKYELNEINNLTKQIKNLKLKVPLFIAVDREVIINNNNFCQDVKNISISLKENGVNLNFGIIGDIGWFPDSFIKLRTYADNPQSVSEYVKKAINCTDGIFTTIKHFPGHGRTRLNSHFTVPEINIFYNDWLNTDASPFKTAINKNINFVMLGHLLYKNIDTQPASLSKKFHKILRDDFKFKGLTITDDLGMLETSGFKTDDVLKQSIEADNDILLYVNSNNDFIDIFYSAVNLIKNDRFLKEQLNNNVKRILELKYTR